MVVRGYAYHRLKSTALERRPMLWMTEDSKFDPRQRQNTPHSVQTDLEIHRAFCVAGTGGG
jgi:hypothetical protein